MIVDYSVELYDIDGWQKITMITNDHHLLKGADAIFYRPLLVNVQRDAKPMPIFPLDL